MGLKVEGEKKCWGTTGFFGGGVHVGLHTADPTASNELSGNAYARVEVAAAGWTINGTSGQASNTAAISFPTPTGAWSDPTHVGIWDAATGGNLLMTGALAADVDAPTDGATVSIAAGALTLTLTTD